MRTFYYSILFSFLLGGVSTSPLNADYYCGTPIVEQDENALTMKNVIPPPKQVNIFVI